MTDQFSDVLNLVGTTFARLVAEATNSFNVLGGELQIESGHYSMYVFPLIVIVSISDAAPSGYYSSVATN